MKNEQEYIPLQLRVKKCQKHVDVTFSCKINQSTHGLKILILTKKVAFSSIKNSIFLRTHKLPYYQDYQDKQASNMLNRTSIIVLTAFCTLKNIESFTFDRIRVSVITTALKERDPSHQDYYDAEEAAAWDAHDISDAGIEAAMMES